MDWLLYGKVIKYYKPEIREKLLCWGDRDPCNWLGKMGEAEDYLFFPDELDWKKFNAEKEAAYFANEVSDFSHLEKNKPFKTGLDWLVENGKKKFNLEMFFLKKE